MLDLSWCFTLPCPGEALHQRIRVLSETRGGIRSVWVVVPKVVHIDGLVL